MVNGGSGKKVRKRTQKPYRQYGFHSQVAYERWVKRWSNVPESDPRYFRRSLRGHARKAEIGRLRQIIRKTKTPANEILRKKRLLVDTLDKLSPFNFLDRYLPEIQRLLADPLTSDNDKRILRRMMKDLRAQIGVDPNSDIAPYEQMRLFR